MKKLTLIVSFLAVTLVFVSVSCTDLTEAPADEITEENFNPTQADIPRLLAPAYSEFRWYLACCYGYIAMQEGAGDSFITPARILSGGGWGGPYLPWHFHTWAANHNHVTNTWNQTFDIINATNRVLYQVQNVVDVSEDVLPGLVAEIRAVRAYAYYVLMDSYGSVPIVTDFTDESVPTQSSREEVYNFVVQELTEAIPNLTDEVGIGTYGRMHRWAAMATLARVYLNAEVYAGTEEYDQVITLTDQIIDSGNFQLTPDYRENFLRSNEGSPEILFAIVYDEVFAGGNTFHMRTLAPAQQAQYQMAASPWGGSSATPQFINTYDEDDTRLEDTWSGGPQFDPQGNEVINFSLDIPSMEVSAYEHGWRINKYEAYPGMQVSSSVDLPLIRYALVLMMKAEALLRTGSPDEAAAIVTQVRERVFADTDPAKATVTGAELMQGSSFNYGYWEDGQVNNPEGGDDIEYGRFLDELNWEFAVEGFRRQDLIRFTTTSGTPVFSAKTWFNKTPSAPCKIVFPIPLSALESNTNLEQHPCYQ